MTGVKWRDDYYCTVLTIAGTKPLAINIKLVSLTRYKRVEGICRRARRRRRKRGYMGVQRLYKGVEGICTVEGYGDRWKYKDDTRDEIRWDMINGTGIVNMEIQGGYQ